MFNRFIEGIERIVQIKLCTRKAGKIFFEDFLGKYDDKLFSRIVRPILDELRLLGTKFAGDTELFEQGCSKQLYSLMSKLEKEFDYQKQYIRWIDQEESLTISLMKFEDCIFHVTTSLNRLGPMRDISNSKERILLLLPMLEHLLRLCQACETEKREISKIIDQNMTHSSRLSFELLPHASSITDYKIAIAHLVPIVQLAFFPIRETKETYYRDARSCDIKSVFILGFRVMNVDTPSLERHDFALKKVVSVLDLYDQKWRYTEIYQDVIQEMNEEIEDECRDLARFTKIYVDGVNYLYQKFKLERSIQHSLDHPVVAGILRAALRLLALYLQTLPLFKDDEEENPVLVKRDDAEKEQKLRSILRKISSNSRGLNVHFQFSL
ncbi:hypothetical protein Ciccas_000779 [Cichlidogyrus casuarinus]|uniref:Uncharacterized protein n=1 Tax=Cichlidogyrus casuarinus TaxID=1844966 RepID=A0ABD2QMD6_9PLAT